MEEIGLKTIVLHPGSTSDSQTETALSQVAHGLNLVIRESSNVRIVLETMCKRGGEIGGDFKQLQYIIERVEKKEKVGICWDTCHLYTAGYDIKNNLPEVITEFGKVIGLGKLWVIHINDSIFGFESKKDRHENIGYGEIGFEALKKIV